MAAWTTTAPKTPLLIIARFRSGDTLTTRSCLEFGRCETTSPRTTRFTWLWQTLFTPPSSPPTFASPKPPPALSTWKRRKQPLHYLHTHALDPPGPPVADRCRGAAGVGRRHLQPAARLARGGALLRDDRPRRGLVRGVRGDVPRRRRRRGRAPRPPRPRRRGAPSGCHLRLHQHRAAALLQAAAH